MNVILLGSCFFQVSSNPSIHISVVGLRVNFFLVMILCVFRTSLTLEWKKIPMLEDPLYHGVKMLLALAGGKTLMVLIKC